MIFRLIPHRGLALSVSRFFQGYPLTKSSIDGDTTSENRRPTTGVSLRKILCIPVSDPGDLENSRAPRLPSHLPGVLQQIWALACLRVSYLLTLLTRLSMYSSWTTPIVGVLRRLRCRCSIHCHAACVIEPAPTTDTRDGSRKLPHTMPRWTQPLEQTVLCHEFRSEIRYGPTTEDHESL